MNVSLILNLQTGLVSLQYHCQYDDLFETTTGTQARSIPTSQWQYKSGLTGERPELNEEEQLDADWRRRLSSTTGKQITVGLISSQDILP